MKDLFALMLILTVMSCSSTKLIDQWEHPDIEVYEAKKVLVVGMSADAEIRSMFEEKLALELKKHQVIAVRSIDFFPKAFTDESRSETDLDTIEDALLTAGFDSILVSKIIGTENKMHVFQPAREYSEDFQNFREYYYTNQHIYHSENREVYKIYHSETSVFCICPGDERELLWRGRIDIVDPYNTRRNITDYVKTLLMTLEGNELVIGH